MSEALTENTPTCLIESCVNRPQTRGYCGSHYHRLMRYGDPTYKPPVTDLSNVDTSLYSVWNSMRSRCYNANTKSYPQYGGRGIWVCNAWRTSYLNFIADVGSRPAGKSIDRINNDAGYTCGHCGECEANAWTANVRWATRKQQSLNSTVVRMLTLDGVTLSITDWTIKLGVTKGLISDRLARGWTIREALTIPRKRTRRYIKPKGVTTKPKNGIK